MPQLKTEIRICLRDRPLKMCHFELIRRQSRNRWHLLPLFLRADHRNRCRERRWTSELELRYIEYLHANFNITIESNDIITDYHIMKNAKTLVCSCSTISWLAAFFSETIQQVYMPNYPSRFLHETFRKPINNTVLYEYKTCSKSELEAFLRTAV